MRDLLILGIGVHALEMVELVDRINKVIPTWNLRGFVSETQTEAASESSLPILDMTTPFLDDSNVFLIADNTWSKRSLFPKVRWATLIDPSSFVSRTAVIGCGTVIFPNCYVGYRASLGMHVFVLSGCIINHDDRIGNRVIMASGVSLAGSVLVDDGCYLGQSCSVRQMLTIGKNSLVGMGSVVLRDVPPDSVMVGNPARKLRENPIRALD